MTNHCSIWAYQEILESGTVGRLQGMYLSIFSESSRPLTVNEAIEAFKTKFKDFPYKSHHGLGSRISELEKMGFLDKFDIVKCTFSGKKVNRWIYNGRRIPKIKSVKRIECPHCKGCGIVDVEEYLDF